MGRRLVRIWRWVLKRPHKRYLRLNLRPKSPNSVARKLLAWGRRLTRKLRGPKGGGDYYRIGDGIQRELPLLGDDLEEGRPPPKGHLAVYVGGWKEGGPQQRYLVPVFYFNHPLFGELLREAEAEFGFHHPGGITIPCPVSKFERVQTRIAAAEPGRKSGAR